MYFAGSALVSSEDSGEIEEASHHANPITEQRIETISRAAGEETVLVDILDTAGERVLSPLDCDFNSPSVCRR